MPGAAVKSETGGVSVALCDARQREIRALIESLDRMLKAQDAGIREVLHHMEQSTAAALNELKTNVSTISKCVGGNGKPGLDNRTTILEAACAVSKETDDQVRITLRSIQEALEAHKALMHEVAQEKVSAFAAQLAREWEARKEAENGKLETFRYYLKPVLTIVYGLIFAALLLWARSGFPM